MKRIVLVICIMILSVCLFLTLACGGNGDTETTPAVETEIPAEEVAAVPTEASSPTHEPIRALHVQEPTDAKNLSDRIAEAGTIETVEIDPGMLSNADIAALLALFPDVSFHYAVKCGDAFVSPDTEDLSVGAEQIGDLADALPCLSKLKIVRLGPCTPEELETAFAALPGIELDYSIFLYGREIGRDAETLDLSDLETLTPDALSAALPYLPALKTVSLGKREDPEAAEAFRQAIPSVDCDYICEFTYLGRQLTSNDETLDLSNTAITDLDGLKETIARLPKLDRVEMIGCGLDNETMAALCDAYPDVRFIWEIDLGYWGKLRTDATAFSTRYSKSEKADKNRMTSEKAQYIRYCTDLVALDLGHQKLTDISFLRPLKKLRVLILVDSYISDISVLGELPELEYIELFMNRVTDVSPLANLTNLQDLNVCSNKISDFSPICSIKTLRRFWYTKNDYTTKDHRMLKEALPDCVLNYANTGTDGGWRYIGNSKERTEREKWKNTFFEGAPRYE